MNKNSKNGVSNIDDLMMFYNKYLKLENDNSHILELINELANSFLNKSESSTRGANEIFKLAFNQDDYSKLNATDKGFLNFYSIACITLDEDISLFINSVGEIISIDFSKNISLEERESWNAYINRNILEVADELNIPYDKVEEAKCTLLQNVLASKIFKVTMEHIKNEYGLSLAIKFGIANLNIVEMEENLNRSLDTERLYENHINRTRSQR